MSQVFNDHEFAARRQTLKDANSRMAEELARLTAQVLTTEVIDQREAEVFTLAGQYAEEGLLIDPPFELNQRIIEVDR